MTNEDILESVISLMAVDGELSQPEMRYFNNLCARLEVSKQTVNQILHNAKRGKGRIHLPDNEKDRKRLLYFLIHALVADGKIGEKERKIMDAVVEKMGISKEYVEEFIQSRMKEIESQPLSRDGIPASWKKQITCPKCGYKQPEAEQCIRCGIIFKRFKDTQEPTDAEKLMAILSSTNVIKGK